jgi:hypothetical protein
MTSPEQSTSDPTSDPESTTSPTPTIRNVSTPTVPSVMQVFNQPPPDTPENNPENRKVSGARAQQDLGKGRPGGGELVSSMCPPHTFLLHTLGKMYIQRGWVE